MRCACLAVPNFLVALARRDDPRLRGQPIVIGGSPEEHSEVKACSREAAAAGVTIGTTLRRALALCPKAVFLALQETHASAEAGRIIDLLQQFSPAVEIIAPGHAHFDVSGLARLAGMDDAAYLRDLHEAIAATTGLPVQLGAAETVFAAHAAAIADCRLPIADSAPVRDSRSASPLISHLSSLTLVPDGASKSFLARLPIEILPLAPEVHQRLRLLGIESVGQVAKLPFSAVQAQFGQPGARAWRLANGEDSSQIVPKPEEMRVTQELELPAPTATYEPLIAGTRALLQRALAQPVLQGHSVRRLDWRLGLESGEALSRRAVFREPTADPARILFALRGKIERLDLPAAAISIALTLSGLCSEYGHQANLWSTGPRRRKELLESIEQLNARTGGPQVYRIVEVQPWSRIPERQLALIPFSIADFRFPIEGASR